MFKINKSMATIVFIQFALLFPCYSEAQKPIKIGMINDFTGSYAAMGQQMKWAVEMAIEEINAKGGYWGENWNTSRRTTRITLQSHRPRRKN